MEKKKGTERERERERRKGGRDRDREFYPRVSHVQQRGIDMDRGRETGQWLWPPLSPAARSIPKISAAFFQLQIPLVNFLFPPPTLLPSPPLLSPRRIFALSARPGRGHTSISTYGGTLNKHKGQLKVENKARSISYYENSTSPTGFCLRIAKWLRHFAVLSVSFFYTEISRLFFPRFVIGIFGILLNFVGRLGAVDKFVQIYTLTLCSI